MNREGSARLGPSARDTADETCRTLIEPGHSGVILRGLADPGRIVAEVRSCLPRTELWFVSGSSGASEDRFGPLSPYLSLTAEETAGPLSAIVAIRALRRRLGAERARVLIIVEQPERLDLGSETLLAACAREGLAQLLVLDSSGNLPGEFAGMLREEQLRLIEIRPFETWELVRELEQQLGGTVPWVVALSVQAWSGGVERWLQPCLDAGLDSGALKRDAGDVWRVSGLPQSGSALSALVDGERALLSLAAREAWELLALAGALPRSGLLRRFGSLAIEELIRLDSVRSADGSQCDCVWLCAELVADRVVRAVPPARLRGARRAAQGISGAGACRRHGARVRLPRNGVSPGSDLAASIDLVHGIGALHRGEWSRAAGRAKAARGLLQVPERGHAFSWMYLAAALLDHPLSPPDPEQLARIVDDPELGRFPEIYRLALASGFASGLPGVAVRAARLTGSGVSTRILTGLAAAQAAGRPEACLSLAGDAAHAGRTMLAVAALCAGSRLAEGRPGLRWRITRELQELGAAQVLPDDVAAQLAAARLTPREEEITLLALGDGTALEIAAITSLSSRTVDWHIGRVLARFGVASRAELRAATGAPGLAGAQDAAPLAAQDAEFPPS